MAVCIHYLGLPISRAYRQHWVVTMSVPMQQQGGLKTLDERDERSETPVRDVGIIVNASRRCVRNHDIQIMAGPHFVDHHSGYKPKQVQFHLLFGVLVGS